MEKRLVICDTDVLIDYFDTVKFMHKSTFDIIENNIGLDNVIISSITKMELYLGATNKRELNIIDKKLHRFNVLLVDTRITEKAIDLLKTYHLSHHLAIPDSLIASAAIITGLELFTYNVKDFKFIRELKLYKPST